MGFRFRKTIGFGSLLRLNLSKTGTSWSIGRPGLTLNLGRGRAKTTVGVPGTGLSYSTSENFGSAPDAEETNQLAVVDAPPATPEGGLLSKLFGPDIRFFRSIARGPDDER